MARIFINYRRDDSPGVAGRLFDHLALKYSRRELFMDVDAMQPGIDFAKQLDTQVAQCHVLLAMIGPRWLDAHDQTGRRRLDNDKDYVRIELASALKRDIAVIPVLVDGAVMPSEESLSDDLKALARRHALELRHTRFDADADAIMRALETVVPRSRVPWRYVAPGAVVAAAIAVIAVFGPKLVAKLRSPPPQIQMSANPAAPNPPAVSVPAAVKPPAPTQALAPANPAAPSGLPAGIKLGEMLSGIRLPGSFFRVTEIADAAACQAACRAETRCVAWTHNEPPGAGQPAHCALKTVIPTQVIDACCTSGIEREPAADMREPPPVPAGVAGALRGIELEGGTYRYFGGADATPEGCQAACRADGQCLAWDYMRPGVSFPDARCFLKNRGSTQVTSPCCIAGIERQVAASETTSPGAPTASAAATAPAAPAAAPAAPAAHVPATAGLPAGAKLGEILPGITMNGSTLRTVDMPQDDPASCQAACRTESRCAAWTYAAARQAGQSAHCLLKAVIPEQVANDCCTSGIERAPAPELREAPTVSATVVGALRGIDLFGGDYKAVVNPQVTPDVCQAVCRAETQCLAWTYVRPGILDSNPRCALKSRLTSQVHSTCCVSAVERQAAK